MSRHAPKGVEVGLATDGAITFDLGARLKTGTEKATGLFTMASEIAVTNDSLSERWIDTETDRKKDSDKHIQSYACMDLSVCLSDVRYDRCM